jgi:hypothetical protein
MMPSRCLKSSHVRRRRHGKFSPNNRPMHCGSSRPRSLVAILRADYGHVSGETHARRNSYAAHVPNRLAHLSRMSRAYAAHMSFHVHIPPMNLFLRIGLTGQAIEVVV